MPISMAGTLRRAEPPAPEPATFTQPLAVVAMIPTFEGIAPLPAGGPRGAGILGRREAISTGGLPPSRVRPGLMELPGPRSAENAATPTPRRASTRSGRRNPRRFGDSLIRHP
jgi:hypothetical protein